MNLVETRGAVNCPIDVIYFSNLFLGTQLTDSRNHEQFDTVDAEQNHTFLNLDRINKIS